MKKIFLLLFVLFFPNLSFGAPATPSGLKLEAGDTILTVSWTANTDTVSGYYVYWGTAVGALDMRKTITGTETREFKIEGLEAITEYFVALSAFDSSSEESEKAQDSKKTTDEVIPAAPTEFKMSDRGPETEVRVTWSTDNAEDDLSYYKIYWGESSGEHSSSSPAIDGDLDSYTTNDLTASTRYYFSITAFDTSGNPSRKSSEIIIDTFVDTKPPNDPGTPEVSVSGENEVKLTFDGNNEGMADLNYYKVYYGEESNKIANETIVNIGDEKNVKISGLKDQTQYYFTVISFDKSDPENPSEPSEEALLPFEAPEPILGNSESFEGGCFIGNASHDQNSKMGTLLF